MYRTHEKFPIKRGYETRIFSFFSLGFLRNRSVFDGFFTIFSIPTANNNYDSIIQFAHNLKRTVYIGRNSLPSKLCVLTFKNPFFADRSVGYKLNANE